MIFFPIFFALLVDHFRPVHSGNSVLVAIRNMADRIGMRFNTGDSWHGRIGWLVLVPTLTVSVLLVHWICFSASVFLAFVFNVVVLYFCMGFEDYSRYFSAVQIELIAGNETRAGNLLAEWRGRDARSLESDEIIRLSIESALLTAHRHVFGVFFWFMIPCIGPAGAVFYRLSAYLARAWAENGDSQNEAFGQFASRVFSRIDWFPSRLTAICFAVVGNFEDAVYAWRNFADHWENKNTGVLLSAGGGALGVWVGTPFEKTVGAAIADVDMSDPEGFDAEGTPGDEPSVRSFQNTTGLIWRALLLWLLLFLFFTIATWLL